MQMTEPEIRTSYRDAPDKDKQISILADLNACDKTIIKRIVKSASNSNDALMLKLYEIGLSDVAISQRVLLNPMQVGKWRKERNLPSKHKQKVNFDESVIMESYQAGMNDVEIGRQFGCNSQTIFEWRKQHGLKANFKKGRAL